MKVFITRNIPGNHIEKLQSAGHEVLVTDLGRKATEEELVSGIKAADAALTLLTDRVDSDLMDVAGPSLKIISNYAVGFDNIDVKAATDRGIVVTNTSCEEVDIAVAEHTLALMFSLTRRIVEADEVTKEGGYKGWEPNIFLGINFTGKTIGIVGLGKIGTMVARKLSSFGVRILYTKKTRDEAIEKELGLTYASLDTILKESDILTLHIPLTSETRHLINEKTLSKLKPGAYLINTARGAIINEQDLADSLRSGHIAGAALDVFDNEPNINPEIIGMENVILTPHIASATHEARDKMGELAVNAILNLLVGTKPSNIINPEVWKKRRK